MKKFFNAIICTLLVSMSAMADNLLLNPGFEEATSNVLGTTFEDWEGTAGNQSIETSDVVSGSQAAHITAARSGSIYQELNMAAATTGQQYELTIHYKLLSSTGTLSLNSYWESNTAGQLQHDEESLWVTLPTGTGWQTYTTHTTRPADGHKLHIALAYTKNIEVLLDDFSLTESESAAPWFTISPEKGGTASCAVGDTVLVNTYTIRQGNLTAPVTLEVVGVNSDQWHLSKTQVTSDNETVSLYYTPTAAGNHRATLLVDCTAATTYSRTFSLTGSASNPTAIPTITLTPTTMPDFTATVGQTVTDTLWVASTNCTDFVNLAVASADAQTNMFLLSSTQLPKNGMYPVVITFAPSAAGSYTSVVTVSSTGAATQTITLQGTATGSGPAPVIDYDTTFVFDASTPLTTLREAFDGAGTYRNKTLHMAGWQNVVRSGSRAWWGYTDDTLAVAKATGYVYQGVLPGDSMETWLITPALSYNVANPTFSFSVQGNALYEGQTARLEAYFIDATDAENPYFEHITALDSLIPANDPDLNGKWTPIMMNLSGVQNAPAAFFIGFRYTDHLSANGSYYYIDNVEWNKIVAKDTLTISVESIVPEPDPNAGTYTFSFLGPDNKGVRQKVQIEYRSESMYGTFVNNDFRNWDGSEGSGTYNYMRPTNSDFQFYPFKNELSAVVADSMGATVIDVNGLANIFGKWTRVLLHGVIPAPAPDDTVAIDLGQLSVIPMNQLGYKYLRLDAANEDYSLAFGIVGIDAMKAGTYYQADLLRPDLVSLPDDTIPMSSATLVVTDADNGYHNLVLTMLGTDNVLYEVSMHTGAVVVTDTVQVVCQNGLIQDLSEMYGFYQIAGTCADYQVTIALNPGVIEKSLREFTNDSVNLAYTRLLDVAANQLVYVQQASGRIEKDSTSFMPRVVVYADLQGINGTLYQVTLSVSGSPLPEVVDTVTVDCGEGVIRVDYTRGIGMAGLVLSHQVGEEVRSANVVFFTGAQLGGIYEDEYFDYEADYAMYVSRVWMDHSGATDTIRTYFTDINVAQMRIDSINDTIHVMLDAYAKNDTLYRFTAWMAPKQALTGESHEYLVTTNDDCDMIGIRLPLENNQAIYSLGLQRAVLDNEGNIDGDAEIWKFVIFQTDWDGIQGEYGYSAGNMDDTEYHVIYEGGTEIYLAPVAGTLHVTAMQQELFNLPEIGLYRAWIYAINAQILAENGQFYNVTGQTYMLCIEIIDDQNERMVELTEQMMTAIEQTLGEQGLRVKKVLRNGMILIEQGDRSYSISGARVE